jgi:predicted DNA-binding transcriptional regulator YafY
LKWLENARIPAVAATAGIAERSVRTDWHDVQIPIESIEQGARQLLGFGAEIEVIEPTALRAEMIRQAARLMAVYREPRSSARGDATGSRK